MTLKRQINHLRRNVFKRLTRHVLTTRLTGSENLGDVKHILIIRPNHRLGNMLLITPLVQEVLNVFPGATVDLFVKGGIAPIVFKNYPRVRNIIQLPKKPFKNLVQYLRGWTRITQGKYEIVINAVSNSSSGKLAAKLSNAPVKLAGELDDEIKRSYPQHRHIALHPVYSFRSNMAKLGRKIDWSSIPNLDLKLSTYELQTGLDVLKGITRNERPTIALYTYATGDKCLPPAWWEPFYTRLQREFPEHNIIEVLPVENVSQLSFKAPSYYSKDIREIASVIANTAVFIGADSGIMHLASAAGAPTIGLFGVTDIDHYRPYNPGSVGLNVNQLSVEDLITRIRSIINPVHNVV